MRPDDYKFTETHEWVKYSDKKKEADVGITDYAVKQLSDLVHIDIHMVEPTPEKNYYTLVTSGMSDRPMNAPAECGELRYAEIAISLPPDWPLTQEAFADENNYWPLRWLKILAIVAVVALIGWIVFSAVAEVTLWEWLGDRIDALTD